MQSFSSATAPEGLRAGPQAPAPTQASAAQGPDAGDGDAQSSASQDAVASHSVIVCSLPFTSYADAKSCFLAPGGGSADTFTALGWKKKRDRPTAPGGGGEAR